MSWVGLRNSETLCFKKVHSEGNEKSPIFNQIFLACKNVGIKGGR